MDADMSAAPGGAALADDYLAITRTRGGAVALERTALRTRSRAARDLLARAAAPEGGSAVELIAAVRRGEPPTLDATWGMALARVVGMQNIDESDLGDSVLLLQELRRQHGRELFVREAQQTVVDRLWQAGEIGLLRSWLPELDQLSPAAARFLRADLVNPFQSPDAAGSRSEWQRVVDTMFTEHRIEPIRVDHDAATPFDGLTCDVATQVKTGPLVTVIISAYRPGPALLTSVRSMCRQTWRNLEILIVDDASGDEYTEVLEAAVALDPRVRLHRMPHNGGTYMARNAAMDLANGEIITCQDSDDWSHPRRIERQVRPLLADPNVSSTRSYTLRVQEDLIFQRPGYDPAQPHAASLMFRREQALQTVGYFDNARKAADTEYRRRLELATGAASVDLTAPLSMYRMGSGSLSRADFTPGWHHVSRWVYRSAYGQWHSDIARGESPRLPHRQRHRRFALPQRFQLDQTTFHDDPPRYDVVMLSDWRLDGRTQQQLLAQIDVLVDAGYRVGVTHMESYRHVTKRRLPLNAQLVRRLNSGAVDFVALDQRAVARLLVVRPPEVFQFPPVLERTIEVDRVVVVADRAPTEGATSGARYDVAQSDAAVRAMFGSEPAWMPGTPAIRAALLPSLPHDRVWSAAFTGASDIESATVRRPIPGERPVVGMRVRGDGVDEEVETDPMWDLRLRGGRPHPGQDDSESSSIWYSDGDVSQRRFVSQLDFYLDDPDSDVADRDVLIALARGCVTVLPPRLEPVYADAAVYAEPHRVADVVRALHQDRDAYRRQSEQGAAAVTGRFGTSRQLDWVTELLGPPAHDAETGAIDASTGASRDPIVGTSTVTTGAIGAPSLSLVLLVNSQTSSRLSSVLALMSASPWRDVPITVVHSPRAQVLVEDAVGEYPGVSLAMARGRTPEALATEAADRLLAMGTDLVVVSAVPTPSRFPTWSQTHLDHAQWVRSLGLDIGLPLLVATEHCPQQVAAAYVHDVLAARDPGPGRLSDYLGGLAIVAGDPRLDAIDSASDGLQLLAWLNAKFLPTMRRPQWRYRLVLGRVRGEGEIRSEPLAPALRVDTSSRWSWEDVVGLLPLSGVAAGTYTVEIEVDAADPQLAVRRRLRPSKGLLFDSRTVAMRLAGSDQLVRYLCHTVGNGERTYLLIQPGSGVAARTRWSLGMLRKDLAFVRNGRRQRRMVMLRLLRLLTMPLLGGRGIWLIGERTDTAQDNGFHLFRKIRAEHPDRRVYYLIDPASPQYQRLAPLGNVVAHSSWRHQLLMLHADVLANAYSIRYMIPDTWYQSGYTRHLAWRIGSLRVYLKHGVHLNANAFKRGLTGYDLLMTVMPRESEALRAVSGYGDQIREIGMPRYDTLVQVSGTRTILFMPTWRQYLTPRLNGQLNPNQMDLEGSDYEQFISGLLSSPRLHDMLERHDFRLRFLPHYNVASFFDQAVTAADRIEVADPNETSFQDLLRRCDVFLTDYSSVHFDIAYMGIPLVYARFDEELYETRHASRSWFDYDRDGYGPVARSLDATLDELERILDRGCTVEEPYATRAATAFTYRDRENTTRVIEAIDDLVATNRRDLSG